MQSILKQVIWVCLVTIPFVALYVATGHRLDIPNWGTSGLYFPFISGKNFIFRILVEVAFFSWVVLALKDASYRLSIRKSPILIAYSIFMGVLLLADIFGVDPFRSFWSNFERMEGYVAHLHFFAYFVVLSAMLRSAADYSKAFTALVVSNVLVLIFGFGQLLGAPGYFFSTHFPNIAAFFAEHFPIHMSENRLDATIGNSAYFAIYCLMFMCILTLLWVQRTHSPVRFIYPTLIALNLIALFYTGTRGTQIGLVVGLLVALSTFVFRWSDSKWQVAVAGVSSLAYGLYLASALFIDNAFLDYFSVLSYAYACILLVVALSVSVIAKEKFRKVGAAVFIAIILIIVGFQQIKTASFVQNSPTLARLASISPNDLTSMSRLSIWKISYEAWKEKPILGYGQENFSYIFASKFIPEKMWMLESWYDRSHDVFFDWLVAAGALGLIAYLSLYGAALYVMWWRKNDMPFVERVILTGALAGYFVHNIFVFDNLTSYILFFFILAYIAQRTGTRGESSSTKPFDKDQVDMVWAPIAGIALVAIMYVCVMRPFIVNRNLVRGLDIQSLLQTMTVADAIVVQQHAFEKAIGMNTLGSMEAREQYLQTGVKMAQITIPKDVPQVDRDRTVNALNGLLTGIEREIQASYPSHNKDVRMLSIYGMFYNGIQEGARAEEVLTEAQTLAPKKQLILFDLVRAYLLQGKTEQAYTLAKQTFDLAPAYGGAAKVYLLASVYAKKFNEAKAYVASKSTLDTFDSDVLTALVQTGQKAAAIEMLTELKKRNPDYGAEVDAYIKQLLAK
ncbi:MAG: hypothetical protein RIQ41_185 [Candidatus Parcubacteria bacterium]|jgi:hypothetical protein